MLRVGFLSSYNRELREPLVWPQANPVSIRVVRGSTSLLSCHGRRIRLQDALKRESRGLSQVAAGNSEFPQLVTVTSGSFSWVPTGCQEYCGVGRGLSGLHCVWCKGRGPHLELRWESQDSSPVVKRYRSVYAFSNRESGLNMCAAWNATFLSSYQRGFRLQEN